MQISILTFFPGYSEYAYKIAVYRDGRLLDNCVAADDVAGTAWVETYTESGRVIKGRYRLITGKIEFRSF